MCLPHGSGCHVHYRYIALARKSFKIYLSCTVNGKKNPRTIYAIKINYSYTLFVSLQFQRCNMSVKVSNALGISLLVFYLAFNLTVYTVKRRITCCSLKPCLVMKYLVESEPDRNNKCSVQSISFLLSFGSKSILHFVMLQHFTYQVTQPSSSMKHCLPCVFTHHQLLDFLSCLRICGTGLYCHNTRV